jgi:predicted nucleotidyltransferase
MRHIRRLKPEPLKFEARELDGPCRKLGVRFAVLFGSRATGSPPPGPESDIDVAVLPGRQDESPSLWGYRRELDAAFTDHSLDLVLLNNADPLLRWEVMERGILLYGDADEFLEYRAFAYRDFVDSADLRALEQDLFLKKMAHTRGVLDAAS